MAICTLRPLPRRAGESTGIRRDHRLPTFFSEAKRPSGRGPSLVGDIICRRGDHLSVMPMLVILPSTLSAFGLLTSVEVG